MTETKTNYIVRAITRILTENKWKKDKKGVGPSKNSKQTNNESNKQTDKQTRKFWNNLEEHIKEYNNKNAANAANAAAEPKL